VPTIKVKPGQLAATLRADVGKLSGAVDQGMRSAAHRGKRLLAKKTPVGAFANMRQSWEVNRSPDARGFILENTAPYAGVIERGARPHGVSPEGIDSIRHWAIRKLGMDALDAENLAWGVAKKLKAEGQPGTYFVRDSIPELAKFLSEEVNRYVGKALDGKGDK
jgi:hypothetical protein